MQAGHSTGACVHITLQPNFLMAKTFLAGGGGDAFLTTTTFLGLGFSITTSGCFFTSTTCLGGGWSFCATRAQNVHVQMYPKTAHLKNSTVPLSIAGSQAGFRCKSRVTRTDLYSLGNMWWNITLTKEEADADAVTKSTPCNWRCAVHPMMLRRRDACPPTKRACPVSMRGDRMQLRWTEHCTFL